MEYRFYVPRMVLCPECESALIWERTPFGKNSLDPSLRVTTGPGFGMRLRHLAAVDLARNCSRAGKVFFAPQLQVDLTEWFEP